MVGERQNYYVNDMEIRKLTVIEDPLSSLRAQTVRGQHLLLVYI